MEYPEILERLEDALEKPEVQANKEMFDILEFNRKLVLNFLQQYEKNNNSISSNANSMRSTCRNES